MDTYNQWLARTTRSQNDMNAAQTSVAGQVAGQVVPGATAGQSSMAGVFTTQGAGEISVAGVFTTQGAGQTPVAGLFSRSAGQTSIAVQEKPSQPALSNCISPEFNDPKADVILVTPEKVSFHVIRMSSKLIGT
jgi:hypothetical protein